MLGRIGEIEQVMLHALGKAVGATENRLIAEPEDTIAACLEIARPSSVVGSLVWGAVIGPIDFDNQSSGEADEIHNIGRHGILGENRPFPKVAVQ